MDIKATSREGSDGALLAKGLGWFSVGLGLVELTAPRLLARAIGIEPEGRAPGTLRLMGARELAAGAAIFAFPRRSLPLWNRVLGDAIDLALLGYAATSRRLSGPRLATAIGSVLGVAALDTMTALRLRRRERHAPPLTATITINRTPAEVYAHWRSLEDLPTFTSWLESVEELDDVRSRWVAKLPTGNTVEWRAEITEDVPGQRLEWRATGGVDLRGTVVFSPAPQQRGTEVRVTMYVGTGGRFGAMLAKLVAGSQVEGDLRRFKQVLETGEVMKSDASIHKGPHPGQPTELGHGQPQSNRTIGQAPSMEGAIR